MKVLLKKFPVFLTVAMLLCCIFLVPASAASDESLVQCFTSDIDQICSLSGVQSAEGYSFSMYLLPVGSYRLTDCIFDPMDAAENLGDPFLDTMFFYDVFSDTYVNIPLRDDGVFEVSEVMLLDYPDSDNEIGKARVYINSTGNVIENPISVFSVSIPGSDTVEPAPDEEPSSGLGFYYQAFDMFAGYIYGEGVDLTAEQNMVLTIMATLAVLFVVVVPFLLLIFFFRLFR